MGGLLPEPVWMQYKEKIIVLDKSWVLFDQPYLLTYLLHGAESFLRS